MNQPLIVYFAQTDYRPRNAVAATLAWLAARHGRLFQVYYDAYRAGEHYGGGNPVLMPPGTMSGGTVAGSHHLEELYLLLHSFQVEALTSGEVAFSHVLRNLHVPLLSAATSSSELLQETFATFAAPVPKEAVLLDSQPRDDLPGLDAYYAPEIYYREAIGLEASMSDAELDAVQALGLRVVRAMGVAPQQIDRWRRRGFDIQIEDALEASDTYRTVTGRLARRWAKNGRGWIVADPEAVSAWLPQMYREHRIAIYSQPQTEVLTDLQNEITSSPPEISVLGRQYHDSDFFKLSDLGRAFQVIDPARPAFPIIAEADHRWPETAGLDTAEPSDDQLREYAREGRVLISLIFWSGMIRELENLYRLTDLAALTGLHAGVVLTAQSFAMMRHPPLTLLTVPQSQGGVFPLLEPLLGSCGVGVAIESCLPAGCLERQLHAAYAQLRSVGVPDEWMPRGWWSTMDAVMLPGVREKRIGLEISRRKPFAKVRYRPSPVPSQSSMWAGGGGSDTVASAASVGGVNLRKSARALLRASHTESVLRPLLEPYRPYEHNQPGSIADGIIPAVASAGFEYFFSKSGFGRPPSILHDDGSLIALNYTAGRWDGWTPFETINHADDIRDAERKLLARRKPGWLVSTIDSCLWTFTGNVWRRGSDLWDIATLAAQGGATRRLVNVTPRVVARYARIIKQMDSQSEAVVRHTTSAIPTWQERSTEPVGL